MPKYVVSSTLENAGWNNSTVLSGEMREEVGRLKREIDGTILVAGSTRLVQTLIFDAARLCHSRHRLQSLDRAPGDHGRGCGDARRRSARHHRPERGPRRAERAPFQRSRDRYVPQTHVLPPCRAVVCHGGFNTVFGALRSRVPLVVVPVSADQPLNTILCEQAGVGISCATDQPPEMLFPITDPAKLTSDVIAEALGRALRDPSFASATAALAGEIEAQPPVTHAVDLIERLVTNGTPVVATS
jgi:hypothetical protein